MTGWDIWRSRSGVTELRVLKLYTVIKRVKWSIYRPGVSQRVGRGIALLFHDHGTRRGWVVSSTPRPHFTPGKDPIPILQEAGWAPGPIWTDRKSRRHRDSIPDCPARSQSLYRLSYSAHIYGNIKGYYFIWPITFVISCWHVYRINRSRCVTVHEWLVVAAGSDKQYWSDKIFSEKCVKFMRAIFWQKAKERPACER